MYTQDKNIYETALKWKRIIVEWEFENELSAASEKTRLQYNFSSFSYLTRFYMSREIALAYTQSCDVDMQYSMYTLNYFFFFPFFLQFTLL